MDIAEIKIAYWKDKANQLTDRYIEIEYRCNVSDDYIETLNNDIVVLKAEIGQLQRDNKITSILLAQCTCNEYEQKINILEAKIIEQSLTK
jgi:hypothetical protein